MSAAVDQDLDAFVDAVFDRPGVSPYGRIDPRAFEPGQRLLELPEAERRRYVVAAVQRIVAYEEAFRVLCEAHVPGSPSTPERQSPAVRGRVLSALLDAMCKSSLELDRSEMSTILSTLNTCDALSDGQFPLTALMKRLTALGRLDEPLRCAALAFCGRVDAGYSRNRRIKQTACRLAAALADAASASVPPAGTPTRAVAHGFTGRAGVLTALKIKARLMPNDPAPVGATIIGPDRFPLRADSPLAEEHAIWTELFETWSSYPNWSRRSLTDPESRGVIVRHPPALRGRLLLALVERAFHGETANPNDNAYDRSADYAMRCVQSLMDEEWTLPRGELFDAVLALALIRSRYECGGSGDALRSLLDQVFTTTRERPLDDPERYTLALLRVAVIEGGLFSRDEAALRRLTATIGDETAGDVLSAGEQWVINLHAAIAAAPQDRRSWTALLRHAAGAPAGKPAVAWLRTAAAFAGSIRGVGRVLSKALTDFAGERHDPVWDVTMHGHHRVGFRFGEPNATVLRGLAHVAAATADAAGARALAIAAASAYRKIPGVGPRAVSVGNACVNALGRVGTIAAVGQLAMLKGRVKFGTAQREIDKAFNAAAASLALPRDELEELGVPTHGLQDVGVRRETFGDATAELRVDGRAVTIHWTRAGKPVKAVPTKVKAAHKEELKAFQAAGRDIAALLPAQAERLDAMFLQQAERSADVWRERYLDHALVGTLARRLIWTSGGKSFGWLDGRLVDATDVPVTLAEDAALALWHPIGRPVDETLAWRAWLDEHRIVQPFKQAHRELYLLTDAERKTKTYSNRFAGHVLRQHQFNALCAARGWKSKLRLMVDNEYPPATRLLPRWDLRAEYWIEGIGGDDRTDHTDSGAFLRVATDQVRFYRTGAAENYAHAGGGRYTSSARGPGANDVNAPLPLDQIPPLVLSEILRDVDLFVGVASVGNDPAWQDGGPEGRHRVYWHDYSFGDLSETAKTRRGVLETLLPRLTKLRGRWTLDEKFLLIRGDLRSYKIHLGSGNILMTPSDQYLCIVPDSSARTAGKIDTVYLPFEGDNTLSIILSKAFLLAADAKIADPTITRQIKA